MVAHCGRLHHLKLAIFSLLVNDVNIIQKRSQKSDFATTLRTMVECRLSDLFVLPKTHLFFFKLHICHNIALKCYANLFQVKTNSHLRYLFYLCPIDVGFSSVIFFFFRIRTINF